MGGGIVCGQGEVKVSLDGRPAGEIHVTGDRLYTVVSSKQLRSALLELAFTPGVNAYSFTFG